MVNGSARAAAARCPCGSGTSYSRCCRPLHLRVEDASTAEQLMRSRYAAFAKGLPSYLLSSWHPDTRPADVAIEPAQRWTALRVIATDQGGEADDLGTVEFEADYEVSGRPGTLREVSRFERSDGRWVYVGGST